MSVIPYLKGPVILEIGFGPGHLQSILDEERRRVFGLDASHQMIRLARKRLIERGQTPHLTRGFAQHLPFAENVFDQVVTTFPADFIYQSETLCHIYRVLKPGGVLIILPVAWITGKNWVDKSLSWLFRFTGQAPAFDPEWLQPINKVGFKSKFELITQKKWTVLQIIAQKPIENSMASAQLSTVKKR
jgi:ubiquinone/menaquinone biosynthesis C-methylase UbiE